MTPEIGSGQPLRRANRETPTVVHVETVDLASRYVTLPSDRVGMVIAQPHVPTSWLSAEEPFQYTEQARPQQLAVLAETLSVARAAGHGASKTHFTVFPEYSIPGFEGIRMVESAVRNDDWPAGTIVIGGTDALTRAQYVELIQGDLTHIDAARNGGGLVQPDQWLNCALTWVKDGDGNLHRWIQPKLCPALPELDTPYQHMFRGGSVFMFKGLMDNEEPFRFGTLVCFDWVSQVGAHTPCDWILTDLQQQATSNACQLPLSWLFVIEHNPKPSHDAFLSKVEPFFNQTRFRNALRDRACLVFANTAGRGAPGRTEQFGGCSAVLSPNSLFSIPSSAPTFSNGGPRFRDGSTLLKGCKDLFFRERGACIHSFSQVIPGSVTAGPTGRVWAIDQALVCPISGTYEPRAPDAPVPATVKWLNDELDDLASPTVRHPAAPLAAAADAMHRKNVGALRVISGQSIKHAVKMAAQESPDKDKDADEWDDIEANAIEHLVHTLDIVGLGFTAPVVGATPAHATVRMHDKSVDLLAIRGSSHEACVQHSNRYVTNAQRQVLLISRDPDNTPWRRRLGSILEPFPPKLGQEPKFTAPSSGLLHLGYQNLLGIFLHSATSAGIEGGIDAELAA